MWHFITTFVLAIISFSQYWEISSFKFQYCDRKDPSEEVPWDWSSSDRRFVFALFIFCWLRHFFSSLAVLLPSYQPSSCSWDLLYRFCCTLLIPPARIFFVSAISPYWLFDLVLFVPVASRSVSHNVSSSYACIYRKGYRHSHRFSVQHPESGLYFSSCLWGGFAAGSPSRYFGYARLRNPLLFSAWPQSRNG